MMEIDFVIEIGDDVLAMEAKSGKTRDAPPIRKVGGALVGDPQGDVRELQRVGGRRGRRALPAVRAAFID